MTYMSLDKLSLVQIMAFRLTGAKPFSELVLTNCRSSPQEQVPIKFVLKYKKKIIYKNVEFDAVMAVIFSRINVDLFTILTTGELPASSAVQGDCEIVRVWEAGLPRGGAEVH